MLLFILFAFVYIIALVGLSQFAPNTSYLPIVKLVWLISGAFACDLLLLILVPPFGWSILILCVLISVRLIYKSHQEIVQCFQQIFQRIKHSTSEAFNILCGWFQNNFQSPCRPAESCGQILQWFQQIFQLINQYTSMAFNKLCGWFQNIFQSLCRATSRAFNSSSIPTANSIEKGGKSSN